MKITKYSVVTMTYQLSVDSGDVVDKTTEEEPFNFIMGLGQVLPEFENKLTGKVASDAFDFILSPEEGYGDYNEELLTEVPKEVFKDAPEDYLTIGNTLPMQDQIGNPIFGVIVEINDELVKMDFNHPLAGEILYFKVKVLSVRAAEASELDLGSVENN